VVKLIVCDWNGTLFADRFEEQFFFGLIRRQMLRSALAFRAGSLARALRAVPRCAVEYLRARRRPDHAIGHIMRIIDALNPAVFRGISRRDLDAHVEAYALSIQTRLDQRLLEPLAEARRTGRCNLGVVSSGCETGIRAALRRAGCEVDFIEANRFRFAGPHVDAFVFRLGENKWPVLEDLIRRQGLERREVMYIGDAPADVDCFDHVGWPVASLQTPPPLRRRFAEMGVHAPADARAFQTLLDSALRDGQAPTSHHESPA
jgi:phosphoserine phosphatase